MTERKRQELTEKKRSGLIMDYSVVIVPKVIPVNENIVCILGDSKSCSNSKKCNRKNSCNKSLKPFFNCTK